MPRENERYQIDFILVRHLFKNKIKLCKAYLSEGIYSKYNLIIMVCDLKFKKINKSKTLKMELRKTKNTRRSRKISKSV